MDYNADKLWKKTLRDQQKRLKPAECQKYLRLVLDHNISNTPFGQELLAFLDSAQMRYVERDLPIPQCIGWERNKGQLTLLAADEEPITSTGAAMALNNEWQFEEQVVQLLHVNQVADLPKDKIAATLGERLESAFPKQRHTLVLLCDKDREKTDSLTETLVALQVLYQLTSWRVAADDAQELFQLLQRMTKAVAEAPYKQQKSKLLHTFKKYLANDKKQCVRVVDTHGFGRLWQQHLNRLPQVTLEVAEAVIAQYSCPKRLLEEYERNPEGAVETIAELRIQRGGSLQPLQTTDRRVGKVLSSKLHTLYNTRDPNALI